MFRVLAHPCQTTDGAFIPGLWRARRGKNQDVTHPGRTGLRHAGHLPAAEALANASRPPMTSSTSWGARRLTSGRGNLSYTTAMEEGLVDATDSSRGHLLRRRRTTSVAARRRHGKEEGQGGNEGQEG